jgi:hypothetical protein
VTYEQWMAEVDAILESRVGLVQLDLPDWLSRDAYEEGLSPEEGADECMTSAGWAVDEFIDEL